MELEILAVAPTGLRDHDKLWRATGVVIDPGSGKSKCRVYLFMHSPVLKFGVDAERLAKSRATIAVKSRVEDEIYEFDVLTVARH